MNLLPSGILRSGIVNILAPGMVIDLEHINKEMDAIEKSGVRITPENLVLSSRATICLPFHSLLDSLEEDRLGIHKAWDFSGLCRQVYEEIPAYDRSFLSR